MPMLIAHANDSSVSIHEIERIESYPTYYLVLWIGGVLETYYQQQRAQKSFSCYQYVITNKILLLEYSRGSTTGTYSREDRHAT